MEYQALINDLNTEKIQGFRFSVKNYGHYRNCVIKRVNEIMPNGKVVTLILAKLTEDGAEKISYFSDFNDAHKIFNMGRKGKFTLKEIWDRIEILEIF